MRSWGRLSGPLATPGPHREDFAGRSGDGVARRTKPGAHVAEGITRSWTPSRVGSSKLLSARPARGGEWPARAFRFARNISLSRGLEDSRTVAYCPDRCRARE